MNIKLKALLLAIIIVASPFAFIFVLFKYPGVILLAAVGFLIYLVYNAVLKRLERKELIR